VGHAAVDYVVRQLKERSDPWHLDDEVKSAAAAEHRSFLIFPKNA
jgi:hypothetical protein